VALDVGQGDAIAIGTRTGWWLVDAGPRSPRWDAGEGTVLPFFRWAGVRSLLAVCATHDDGDHTGGLDALRRGMPVRAWYGPASVPGVPGPAARYGLTPIARGDSLSLEPSARVLWPPRGDAADLAVAGRGDNAASLVLELGTGEGRALLTADTDSLSEACLKARERPALLKAGHHGSASSSGAAFLMALSPAFAILSCGVRNPYGHPAPSALARLAASGARADRTDLDGTLWYELSDGGATRMDWRAGEPLRSREPSAGAAGAARAARSK
jgi:competence protein ComEC